MLNVDARAKLEYHLAYSTRDVADRLALPATGRCGVYAVEYIRPPTIARNSTHSPTMAEPQEFPAWLCAAPSMATPPGRKYRPCFTRVDSWTVRGSNSLNQ